MKDLVPPPPSTALVTALNLAWAASRRAQARRFHTASRDPERFQQRWLSDFLSANAGTAYGRAHRFAFVTSPEDFRKRVPVTTWDDVAPWVQRVEVGEREVLTREPVKLLERTSGTSSGPKHIPYTAGLLEDFAAATAPWLDDVFTSYPALFTTRQYWSISPAARAPEVTAGGLRVGLEDDTEYFEGATRWALRRLMALDGRAARLRSMDTWRDTTLRALATCGDLGFISVWNPSFLTLLMEQLSARWEEVESWLPPARREEVRRGLDRTGAVTGEALWPRLQLLSCWTDAWAARALPGLRRFFPRTPLQGKGLLATEGVVSFPLVGLEAPVAAVTSHYLEFEALDDDGRPAKGVHELRPGARYAPLLTTRGGLVRYRLPDVVRCVGHYHRAPLLRFEGRLDHTGDIRGEKLHAARAEAAVQEACAGEDVRFAFLAPTLVLEPPRYVLFLEADGPDEVLRRIAARVEQRLEEDLHYRYCRDLGQLAPVEAKRTTNGQRRWLDEQLRRGLRLGDVKATGFDPRPEWDDVFS
ncbi:MAG: GH3 auxin-responsive promoter family protein [Myxococcota bacterium]